MPPTSIPLCFTVVDAIALLLRNMYYLFHPNRLEKLLSIHQHAYNLEKKNSRQ
ncbi:MAG: hypothetical protein AAGI07_03640 [Bacteroidota bacterium]